jgi:hypothetical protein
MKNCNCEPFQTCLCKPGPKPPKKRNNQKKIGRGLEPPEKKHCRRCGILTGTEAYRHAENRLIKYFEGGGIMGSRINDNLSAFLCHDCDREMSEPIPKSAAMSEVYEHGFYWLKYIVLTHLID